VPFDWSTVGLLAAIRRRAASESATATGTADADLLSYADEELQATLLPLLLQSGGDNLLPQFDYEVSTTASTAAYRLPYRAAFNRVREVALVYSGQVENLSQASLDEVEEWSTTATGKPEAYYVRGAKVVLLPTPDAAYTLRISYAHRPSRLVASTLTVATVSGTAVTTSAAHGFSASSSLDYIKASSPFDVLSIDNAPSAASGSSITLSAAIADLAVGDYVVTAGNSPVPQIPAELHPALVDLAVAHLLKARGFLNEAAAWRESVAEKVAQAVAALSPRVDGEPRICVPGPHGLLGGADYGGRFRWGW
jgi:hypothetical protein